MFHFPERPTGQPEPFTDRLDRQAVASTHEDVSHRGLRAPKHWEFLEVLFRIWARM